MRLKIVLRSFVLLFLFSVVNAADEEKDLIESVHKTYSVVSIAVSNVFVYDPVTTAPVLASYSSLLGIASMFEFVCLKRQGNEEKNAFHKLVQSSFYLLASNYINNISCGSRDISSVFLGSTFLILAGLNGYCKIDEQIYLFAQLNVDKLGLY